MRREGLEAQVGELEDLVVEGERAHVDAGVAARQVGRALPGVLQRLPGHLQQFALLRVHVVCLAGADAEEGRFELVEAVDVPAPARRQLSGFVPVPGGQGGGVVAVGRGGGEAVLAAEQVPPEGAVVAGCRRAAYSRCR